MTYTIFFPPVFPNLFFNIRAQHPTHPLKYQLKKYHVSHLLSRSCTPTSNDPQSFANTANSKFAFRVSCFCKRLWTDFFSLDSELGVQFLDDGTNFDNVLINTSFVSVSLRRLEWC